MSNPTAPLPGAGELDVPAIKTAFRRLIRERCPEHEEFALALLERLPPERWRLEWRAPWWLGQAFGLDPVVSRDLVLSNVLGLASIRVEDDLADAEVPLHEAIAARDVRAALFGAAVELYRRRFERGSPFWEHFDRLLAAWRDRGRFEAGTLTAVGAPLKVGAIATCLLSGRDADVPEIEGLFDDAIESLVLDDHVADWEPDLAAGRWNVFVESTVGSDQSRDPAAVRRRMLVALMTTDAVPRTFTKIVAGFQRAAGRARALDPRLAPLADALDAMADDARDRGAGMARHYQELGDQAAKLLRPASRDARS